MNRADMREVLRNRIKDAAEVDYDTPYLNRILNDAASFVQKEIMKVDPTAFLKITRQHIVADIDRYRKPEGIWSLMDVAAKDSTTGRYVSLGTPTDFLTIRSVQSTEGVTGFRFAMLGEEILLGPVPETDVTDGLEWVWVYSASMAADTDILPIHIGLHNAVVLRAEILIAPETAAQGTLEVRKQLQEELNDIGDYYRTTVGVPAPFQPQVTKGY